MCHVIVTCRSMLWTLLSIVVAFAELVAFISADWLIGKAKTRGAEPADTDSEPYYLGILCIRTPGMQQAPRDALCGTYAKSFGDIASGFWQATAIFLAMGIFILCVVALVSVFTMCVQSIMKKSIFNVCGLLQGIAGCEIKQKHQDVIASTIWSQPNPCSFIQGQKYELTRKRREMKSGTWEAKEPGHNSTPEKVTYLTSRR